ncbi:MAG: metallophosphoesterase [Lachnospiraceae bacterium]|nr:metallophosphoesterase [Lachnospiraceae bacterium]
MIYITGDCHADFARFNMENFSEQKEMTKDDYVIICGDFGGVWAKDEESEKEKWWLDWLEGKSFTTLFVDGNHENFARLYSYPVEEWNGGKVHRIRPSVVHLMRGQVFTLEGKKIFAFGGARSHDIDGGILEYDDPIYHILRKALDRNGKSYRVNHYSWWEQEMPSDEEMDEGIRNLALHNNKIDFIVSHCCAASTQALIGEGTFKRDYLNDYFEKIRSRVEFKKWFFGHYHNNINVNVQEILIYEQIIRIV